jgi:hypothetical protein
MINLEKPLSVLTWGQHYKVLQFQKLTQETVQVRYSDGDSNTWDCVFSLVDGRHILDLGNLSTNYTEYELVNIEEKTIELTIKCADMKQQLAEMKVKYDDIYNKYYHAVTERDELIGLVRSLKNSISIVDRTYSDFTDQMQDCLPDLFEDINRMIQVASKSEK